jgi:hypothetical protein
LIIYCDNSKAASQCKEFRNHKKGKHKEKVPLDPEIYLETGDTDRSNLLREQSSRRVYQIFGRKGVSATLGYHRRRHMWAILIFIVQGDCWKYTLKDKEFL